MINLIQKIKGNKILSDSFWSLFGNVVGRGLSLFSGIFVARLLTAEVFGEYSVIRNTILIIGIFSTFGLGYTSTKYVAEYKSKYPNLLNSFIQKSFRFTLIFSLLLSLLIFVFSDIISVNYLKDIKLSFAVKILSVILVFNALTNTQIAILAGFGEFKKLAKINSIVGVLTFFLSILLTYYLGFNGALLALILTQIINWSLNYLSLNKVIKLYTAQVESHSQHELLSIVKFSTPVALQEFIYTLTSWLSYALLINFSSFIDLGVYNAAMQWNAIILFIPGILRNVILSHLSSTNDDITEHKKILKLNLIVNFIICFFSSIVVFTFSGFIADLYGESFSQLKNVISIAVFSTVFISLGNVYTQAFMSLGLNWIMLTFRIIRDVSILLFSYLLIKTFNNYSSLYILLFCNLIINILFYFSVSKFYNSKYGSTKKIIDVSKV